MDQITLVTISANNIFMARESGKAITETEYLYMNACMDYLAAVHKAKALELNTYLEKIEDERLKKDYPENHKNESKTDNEDGPEQSPEGDSVRPKE